MRDQVPTVFRAICDCAGEEAAVALSMKCGGARLLIPQKATGTVLEGHVGAEAAAKISAALSDERLYIPKANQPVYRYLRARGWSQERCARELKIARRTAQNWDKGSVPSFPDAQSDLFSQS